MLKYFYFNGKILPLSRPVLSANDLGLLRSYAVFDFLRTYQSLPFHLHDHYRRLVNSAQKLDLRVPLNEQQVAKIIADLLKKNRVTDASFRLVLTGGASVDGLHPGPTNFYILAEETYRLPERLFVQGAKLLSCSYERFLPETKNTNYLLAVSKLKQRKRLGAVELLYLDRTDGVLECSTSNIFLVKNKRVITPKIGVLPGITRKIVLSLAKQRWSCEERPVTMAELKQADEIFITATNKDVLPIVKIDDWTVASGRPGAISQSLLQDYRQYIEKRHP